MGDLVIAIGAVRSEGTPNGYVPPEYPAIASLDVVNALVGASKAAGAPHHIGIIRSVDALYSDLVPDTMPRPHLRDELAMWSDRKSTRLNSSHDQISYAVFCL